MTRVVRTELAKLATLRMTYGLLASAAVVTALFTSLQSKRAGNRVAAISTHAGLATDTTAHAIGLLLAAVLGVIAASGEFRHGSATLTYLATPNRRRVLLAKIVAILPFGALYGLTAGVVSTGVALSFVSAKGDHVTLSTSALIGHILGAGVGAALLAAIGVVVGSLVRSQIAGVIGVFIWCLVIESVVGANVTSIRPYLPYTAASTLGGAKLGAAAFGPGFRISGQSALPFVGAALVLVAIAAVLAAVADRSALRADVQ
jgi:ABC-type transport system involved in multi-copper enzyme maturation permease subunit